MWLHDPWPYGTSHGFWPNTVNNITRIPFQITLIPKHMPLTTDWLSKKTQLSPLRSHTTVEMHSSSLSKWAQDTYLILGAQFMSSDKCMLLCFWEWDQEREHLPPVPADITPFSPRGNNGLPADVTPFLALGNHGLPADVTPFSALGNHGLPVDVMPFSSPGNHGLPSWPYVKFFPPQSFTESFYSVSSCFLASSVTACILRFIHIVRWYSIVKCLIYTSTC